MPWSSEFAQFPTPMIATRTLPSSRRACPFELPFVSDIRSSMNQLLADVQDALADRDPRGGSEEIDGPLEAAPRCEDEAGRDHDDSLRAGAEPDIAAQAERLRLRADVRDQDRARDGRDREDDRDVVARSREAEA